MSTPHVTALVPRHDNAMTEEQVALVKRTICKGATDDELAMFVQTSQRLGLDPFARQIFAVKRWDKNERREVMSIQVSIDGCRLVAERTHKYAGQLGPFWTADGKEWLEVWLGKDPPGAAKVGVLRHDFKEPVWSVATWDQYKQTKNDGTLTAMWNRMGPLMLAKCAESLALRRAFPNELSGVYSQEEMAQAEVVTDRPKEEYTPPTGGAPGPKATAPSAGHLTAPVPAQPTPSTTKAPHANTIKHDGKLATHKQVTYLHVLRGKVGVGSCDGGCAKPAKKFSKRAGGLVDVITRCTYHTQLAAFRDQKDAQIETSTKLSEAQIASLIERYEAKLANHEAHPPEPIDIADINAPEPGKVSSEGVASIMVAMQGKDVDVRELLAIFNADQVSALSDEHAGMMLSLVLAHGTPSFERVLDDVRQHA